MRVTFLFWNIKGNPIEHRIAKLAEMHKVDILILAECKNQGDVLATLNSTTTQYRLTRSNCRRIVIFTKLPQDSVEAISEYETDKLTVRRLVLPNKPELLLVSVHALSKLHAEEYDKKVEVEELSRTIRKAEQESGHSRTILVGDLNINPFETAVVAAAGLHAVMTRKIALKKERKVQGKRYPYFYNPMWGLWGDATDGPGGTYYFNKSKQKELFWHMIDQVLLRPDLLRDGIFVNRELRILSEDDQGSFLSENGLPKSSVSDHLPILFSLNL